MKEVVIVTGASSGVGEALAPLLAERGYRVYGMSRRRVDLPGVTPLPCDVSQAAAVGGAAGAVVSEAGRVDWVIHCAGIGGAGPVEQMPTDRAKRIMDTNFWGTWNICQAFLPHLRRSPRGRLLVVGSIAGYMGIPFRGAYCASKAATQTLVDSLRMELKGSPCQAAYVAPGDIATNSIATQYRQPYAEVDPLYRSRYEAADAGMAGNVDHGMSARHVAERLYEIARQDRLAPHYLVGEPLQRVSVTARQWLPGRWWEWVLGRYYG